MMNSEKWQHLQTCVDRGRKIEEEVKEIRLWLKLANAEDTNFTIHSIGENPPQIQIPIPEAQVRAFVKEYCQDRLAALKDEFDNLY